MIKEKNKKAAIQEDNVGWAGIITSISFSCPAALKPVIRRRALELDLSVSQYIRKLINADLNSNG